MESLNSNTNVNRGTILPKPPPNALNPANQPKPASILEEELLKKIFDTCPATCCAFDRGFVIATYFVMRFQSLTQNNSADGEREGFAGMGMILFSVLLGADWSHSQIRNWAKGNLEFLAQSAEVDENEEIRKFANEIRILAKILIDNRLEEIGYFKQLTSSSFSEEDLRFFVQICTVLDKYMQLLIGEIGLLVKCPPVDEDKSSAQILLQNVNACNETYQELRKLLPQACTREASFEAQEQIYVLLETLEENVKQSFQAVSYFSKKIATLESDSTKKEQVSQYRIRMSLHGSVMRSMQRLPQLKYATFACSSAEVESRIGFLKQKVKCSSPCLLSTVKNANAYFVELWLREWWIGLHDSLKANNISTKNFFFFGYTQACALISYSSNGIREESVRIKNCLETSFFRYQLFLGNLHTVKNPTNSLTRFLKTTQELTVEWTTLAETIDSALITATHQQPLQPVAAFSSADIDFLHRYLKGAEFDLNYLLPQWLELLTLLDLPNFDSIDKNEAAVLKDTWESARTVFLKEMGQFAQELSAVRKIVGQALAADAPYSTIESLIESLPKRINPLVKRHDALAKMVADNLTIITPLLFLLNSCSKTFQDKLSKSLENHKQAIVTLFSKQQVVLKSFAKLDPLQLHKLQLERLFDEKQFSPDINSLYINTFTQLNLTWGLLCRGHVVFYGLRFKLEALIREKQNEKEAKVLLDRFDDMFLCMIQELGSGSSFLPQAVQEFKNQYMRLFPVALQSAQELHFFKQLEVLEQAVQNPDTRSLLYNCFLDNEDQFSQGDSKLLGSYVECSLRQILSFKEQLNVVSGNNNDDKMKEAVKTLESTLQFIKMVQKDKFSDDDNMKYIHLWASKTKLICTHIDAVYTALNARRELDGTDLKKQLVKRLDVAKAYSMTLPLCSRNNLVKSLGKGEEAATFSLLNDQLQQLQNTRGKIYFSQMMLLDAIMKETWGNALQKISKKDILNKNMGNWLQGFAIMLDIGRIIAQSKGELPGAELEKLKQRALGSSVLSHELLGLDNQELKKTGHYNVADLFASNLHRPWMPVVMLESISPSETPTQADIVGHLLLLNNIELQIEVFSILKDFYFESIRKDFISNQMNQIKTAHENFFKDWLVKSGLISKQITDLKRSFEALKSKTVDANRQLLDELPRGMIKLKEDLEVLTNLYSEKTLVAYFADVAKMLPEKSGIQQIVQKFHLNWKGLFGMELQWLSKFSEQQSFFFDGWDIFLNTDAPISKRDEVSTRQRKKSNSPKENNKRLRNKSRSPKDNKDNKDKVSKTEEIVAPVTPASPSVNINKQEVVEPIIIAAPAPQEVKKTEWEPLKILSNLRRAISNCPIQGARQPKEREEWRKRAFKTFELDHLTTVRRALKDRERAVKGESYLSYCSEGITHLGYAAEQLLEMVGWTYPMYEAEDKEHDCINKVSGQHAFDIYSDALKKYSKNTWNDELRLLGSKEVVDALERLSMIQVTQRYAQKKKDKQPPLPPAQQTIVAYFTRVAKLERDLFRLEEMRAQHAVEGQIETSESWTHQTKTKKVIDEAELKKRGEELIAQADQYYDTLFRAMTAIIENGFK